MSLQDRLNELIQRWHKDAIRARVDAMRAKAYCDCANELSDVVRDVIAPRQEKLANAQELLASLNVAIWGSNSHTYATFVSERILDWIRENCGQNNLCPVYQAKEWQCRHVFPDSRCCGLKIGHDGGHVAAGSLPGLTVAGSAPTKGTATAAESRANSSTEIALRALRSIAANSCCLPCREAAVVAQRALSDIEQ